jgi:hypothetical protein
MASKISRDKPKAVPLAQFAADIDRRRAEYEERVGSAFEIPRNGGNRRTASKRTLLKAIEEAGGKW